MTSNQTASLEDLGRAIGRHDVSIATFDVLLAELKDRVDGSESKATALMDYHYSAFKGNATSQHWCELQAMMALVQSFRSSSAGL
jgi:hypothetical protein